MVSSLHEETNTVVRVRRKPRATTTNRQHLERVWGNTPKAPVCIPMVIDNYNHWMLGVDKWNQLRAYYRHKLRCRRTWMPIMFHCMDGIRVNAFVAYNALVKKKLEHKEFVMELVNSLLRKAAEIKYGQTRAAQAGRVGTIWRDF